MKTADTIDYADLQALVEHGRKLHSQAVFEAFAGLISRLRLRSEDKGRQPAPQLATKRTEHLKGV